MSIETEIRPTTPKFASIGTSQYPVILAVFCGLLLISNIGATKLIEFGPIITDGGAFLFPLVYITGDVLSEVYGFHAARKAIFVGFALAILAALTFWVVQISPAATSWPNQEAFESVLGFVPRIVLASICGYLVGQLLNAYVLVRIKEWTKEKALWLRLIGSTVVGSRGHHRVLHDRVLRCDHRREFLNYVIVGYFYKVLLEVVLLPITYRVIAVVKKHEPTYGEPESVTAVPAS